MTPAQAAAAEEAEALDNRIPADESETRAALVLDAHPPAGARIRNGFAGQRGDGVVAEAPADDEDSAEELMLLREENARLKSDLHRPPGVGTVIEQLRVLANSEGPGEALDEVWNLLSECLVIREGLDRVCVELQDAIGDIQQRLARLAIRIEEVESSSTSSNNGSGHQNGSSAVHNGAIAP